MFVPGVNGSIIANSNAPSGSRLKGAYKNSKKRKMPNGGSTGFGMAVEAASYIPGPIGMYASGASAVSNIAQGDYMGAGLDALNIVTGGTAKGLMGVARVANRIRPYSNLAIGAAQASRTVNRVNNTIKPITRVAGTVNEFSVNNNNTMRVPQRDNAQVVMRPNPNRPIMANGGRQPITNVSSQGDLDYSVSKRLGNFTGNLQGSVNVPSMSSNYVQPKLSYDRKALSSYLTPSGFGGGIQGNKAYVNYDQSKEGRDVYRSGAAGYNTDKVNVNANANFRNNLLENAGVTGSYNINPNLSVVGNYNVSQGESGLNPNYFAGFKFNKTFEKGGETDDDDDKDMVNGVASILRRVKDKKNRLQLANQLSKQFNREKVKYDLASFLAKSKVKK